MRKPSSRPQVPDWSQLLVDAITKPGTLSAAYRQFWNYSIGNQLLALFECIRRDIEPGPIHTFKGWLSLGRHVRKGEKAITLCMPITIKRKLRKEMTKAMHGDKGIQQPDDSKASAGNNVTLFVFRSRWFVLSQTEGDAHIPTEMPKWSESLALSSLRVERIAFTHLNGNCQGFARGLQISISPVATLPHKTLFHELAHVVLKHTADGQLDDHPRTPRNLREVEAESVALICCESLNLPGVSECRGYIQHWLDGQTISQQIAQRIFGAADAILKAGCPTRNQSEDQ